uniref:Electron transfer flavoprotein regulatory factor 1 n=1 Tax=Leptobrachium leishanense TaxID=445787 RepID=A0A8C5QLA5_9ANUR
MVKRAVRKLTSSRRARTLPEVPGGLAEPCAETRSGMANPLRGEVVKLYKNLLFLGREYPKGEPYFKERLKKAFMKNKDVTDPEKIRELVARGEFVVKELEALYYLRKYRAMKQRYYAEEHEP